MSETMYNDFMNGNVSVQGTSKSKNSAVTSVPPVFNYPGVNKGLVSNITYSGYAPEGKFVTSGDTMDFAPGGITSTSGYGDNKLYAGTGDTWSVTDLKTGKILDQSGKTGLDTFRNIGIVSDAVTGLVGIDLGYKQLGLGKDKFAFDKDMMNKQYAMAKDAYDKNIQRSDSIGSQMSSGKVK